MTTVVNRLAGVTFSDTTLPKAFFAKNIVASGLLAAYRFADYGVEDFSGNGKKLSSVGAPSLASGYATAAPDNFYDTGLVLPPSFTMLAIFRVPNTIASSLFVVGDYVGNGSGGMCLFSAGGNYPRSALHTTDFPNNMFTTTGPAAGNVNWTMQALRHDAGIKKATWDIPKTAQRTSITYTGTPVVPGMSVKIGTVNVDNVRAGAGDRNIAEVLIYDRYLSDAEIDNQYAYSKAWAAAKSITGI